jgi:hypothetical protein
MAMIAEWRGINEYQTQLAAFLNNGGTLPGKDEEDEEYFEVHPDAF